jgi:peptidase E
VATDRTPTILATSGAFVPGELTELAPGPLIWHAIELAGRPGRTRLCYLGTAAGDQRHRNAAVHEAFYGTDIEVTCLNLYPRPNLADPDAHLLAQDVIWVGGGSVAGLLALWRLHGLDLVLRRAWEKGVVLAGISAGSICWHIGGTTDSFGAELRPITGGLGLVPYSNGVHHDGQPQRRPLFQRLIAEGALPAGYATDDEVGLVYRGTEMVEAVAQAGGKHAYWVEPDGQGGASETVIEARLLPASAGGPPRPARS